MKLKFNLRDPRVLALIAHCRANYTKHRKPYDTSGKPLTEPSLMLVKDSGAYIMSPFPLQEGDASCRLMDPLNSKTLHVCYAQGCGPQDGHIGGDDFAELVPIPVLPEGARTLEIILTENSMTVAVEGPAQPAAVQPGPQITKELLKALRADIDAALVAVGARHGVKLRAGNAKFEALTAHFKLEVGLLVGGVAVSPERAHLLASYQLLGFEERHLTQEFQFGRDRFVLDGFNAKKAKPFTVRKVGHGGLFVMTRDQVRAALGIKLALA